MTQNAELQKALDATTQVIQQIAEKPPPVIETPTANQAVSHEDFQSWASRFASDISSQISALTPLSNPNTPPNNRGGGGGGIVDRTGYWCADLCGNCGVQLGITPGQGIPGRCRDKCKRITSGRNCYFPTEEQRKKVTMNNYNQFLPNVCIKNIKKQGKEWSTTIPPAFRAHIRREANNST